MPLSEEELRLLEQMERALQEEDPKFASALRGNSLRRAAQRRAMHGFYCRGDIAQQQYQKKLLRPETQAVLTPELRRVLARDDPRNDELSVTGSGRSGFLK